MKVLFDLKTGKLSIDGDAPDLLKVLEAARSLVPSITHIQLVTSPPEDPGTPIVDGNSPTAAHPPDQSIPKTMRSFCRALTLTNAAERIAAIGYYVNRIEGRASFSPKDMDGWFTMCGFQKPSQMPVATFDTKRKYGYIENMSRGMWRITTQGENLILGKLEQSES